jgi:putative tricarboxylic transport membrane protein
MIRLRRAVPYLVLLGFSIFLLWSLSGVSAPGGEPGALGPAFWPRAILIVMMLLCAYEILKRLAGAKDQFTGFIARQEEAARRGEEVGSVATLMASAPSADVGTEQNEPLFLGKLLPGISLIALYAMGIQTVGFFLSSTVFLSAFAAIGGARHRLWNPVVSVIGSLLFFFVFTKIAYISLPLGTGIFKEISLALMQIMGVK